MTKDDRVLVLGATGGVGSIIVSLAHRLGATVWGQSNDPASVAWLQARGADRVVTAGADALASEVGEFQPTVVFDPLGDGFTGAAIQSLAPRGRLVTLRDLGRPRPARSRCRPCTVPPCDILGYGGLRDSDEILGAALATALSALADGRLDVAIGKTLPLSQVNEAFELLAARKVRGKLVLDLQHEPRHRGGQLAGRSGWCFIRLQRYHVVTLDVDAA